MILLDHLSSGQPVGGRIVIMQTAHSFAWFVGSQRRREFNDCGLPVGPCPYCGSTLAYHEPVEGNCTCQWLGDTCDVSQTPFQRYLGPSKDRATFSAFAFMNEFNASVARKSKIDLPTLCVRWPGSVPPVTTTLQGPFLSAARDSVQFDGLGKAASSAMMKPSASPGSPARFVQPLPATASLPLHGPLWAEIPCAASWA